MLRVRSDPLLVVLNNPHACRSLFLPTLPTPDGHLRRIHCRASEGSQEAYVSSLRSLSVHRLDNGHYIAPLLCSSSLPFAVGLELFIEDDSRADNGSIDCSFPEVEAEELLSLQYILDGRGQALQQGSVDAVMAGDSLLSRKAQGIRLAPSCNPDVLKCPDAWPAHRSSDAKEAVVSMSSQDNPSICSEQQQWDLVALKVLLADDKPGCDGGAAALARAVAAWRAAPPAGRLSEAVVAGIIRRSREAAAAAFPSSRTRAIGTASQHTASGPPSASADGPGDVVSEPLTHQQGAVLSSWDEALPEPLRAALRNTPADFLRYILPGLIGRSAAKPGAAAAATISALADEFASDGASNNGSSGWGTGGVQKKGLQELAAYRLPKQTNRLALVFDPLADGVPFTFGLEIFEPGHKTPPHTHPSSQELFFILAGDGEGFCDGRRFPVAAGDAVAFPARSVHGIDVSPAGRMYCLELMQPNDMFAEFVKAGQPLGGLADEDLCVLAALGCGGQVPAEEATASGASLH